MKININYETAPRMFELCKKHKEGKLKRNELEALLDHKDYQVEFERYNNECGPNGKFSKKEYADFFMNFFDLEESNIKQKMLRNRYSQLKHFFDNIDIYEKKIDNIKNITEDDIRKALEYTHMGLPDDIRFDELNLIFSIGLGASGGWFYKNYSHFDLVKFLEEIDSIPTVIAHECHHIGFNKMFENLDITEISPEEFLYLFIAGEGLAIKYCNNGEGVLTKKIYDDTANIGLDEFTWDYLSKDFHNIYTNFKSQIGKIRSGEIKDINDLNKYISDYWMNPYTEEQDRNEVPKLKHTRNYSFGNEVWGLIHDVYGREKVFDTLKNLKQFPKIFNSALKEIGRTDLFI
ncbi:hypothetical protein LGK97_15750 [Clostridium sp. CS001]|uniref:DUF5700 domain-containing putative Zn-dependent protease n=1 Tax=Clostridium sp. CS001 TaxID=2880648 RepID=UPI001CF3B76D|nr:DUF5700 domain-containing putative Zn-dependent protease [Clostridium sp. CS001]MCB2291184.1 hypothetical protein [Clostridium sp. CS001]